MRRRNAGSPPGSPPHAPLLLPPPPQQPGRGTLLRALAIVLLLLVALAAYNQLAAAQAQPPDEARRTAHRAFLADEAWRQDAVAAVRQTRRTRTGTRRRGGSATRRPTHQSARAAWRRCRASCCRTSSAWRGPWWRCPAPPATAAAACTSRCTPSTRRGSRATRSRCPRRSSQPRASRSSAGSTRASSRRPCAGPARPRRSQRSRSCGTRWASRGARQPDGPAAAAGPGGCRRAAPLVGHQLRRHARYGDAGGPARAPRRHWPPARAAANARRGARAAPRVPRVARHGAACACRRRRRRRRRWRRGAAPSGRGARAGPRVRDAHTRFVFVHPVSDGNGRTARTLVGLVLQRFGLPGPVFTRELRSEYMAAAATGTSREYAPLAVLHAAAVRRSLAACQLVLSEAAVADPADAAGRAGPGRLLSGVTVSRDGLQRGACARGHWHRLERPRGGALWRRLARPPAASRRAARAGPGVRATSNVSHNNASSTHWRRRSLLAPGSRRRRLANDVRSTDLFVVRPHGPRAWPRAHPSRRGSDSLECACLGWSLSRAIELGHHA